MIRLPIIGFRSPPVPPGGGVMRVKTVTSSPATPFQISVPRMSTSHRRPKAAAPMERPSQMRFLVRRRVYIVIASPRLYFEAREHVARDREHDERDHEQDESERDQRRGIEIADRFGEFVGDRSRDRRSRRHDGSGDLVRVTDHEGDGHRLAERAAEPEHHAAQYARTAIGQHHIPDHFPSGRAERVGGFFQHTRRRLEHIARNRTDERDYHDREDQPRREHADAVRRTGEKVVQKRNTREQADDRGLHVALQKRRENEQAPDAVDDARDAGQKLDRDCDRLPKRRRTKLGNENRDPDADRNGNSHRDQGSHDRAVDRRKRAELFGNGVPALRGQKFEAESLKGGPGADDERKENAEQDGKDEKCCGESEVLENRVLDDESLEARRAFLKSRGLQRQYRHFNFHPSPNFDFEFKGGRWRHRPPLAMQTLRNRSPHAYIVPENSDLPFPSFTSFAQVFSISFFTETGIGT